MILKPKPIHYIQQVDFIDAIIFGRHWYIRPTKKGKQKVIRWPHESKTFDSVDEAKAFVWEKFIEECKQHMDVLDE